MVLDEKTALEIRVRLSGGILTCAAAMSAAEALNADPFVIGRTANELPVRLGACQLGLFGFPGHAKGWSAAKADEQPVPDGFEDAVRAARGPDGSVSCAALWDLAARFALPRLQVGLITDRLGIPIRSCQLGAF